MELSRKQIDEIAYRTAVIVIKKLKEQQDDVPEMVSTAEAAKILGITAGHMRRIQHRFPHVKAGENKQGKLLFKRDALLQHY